MFAAATKGPVLFFLVLLTFLIYLLNTQFMVLIIIMLLVWFSKYFFFALLFIYLFFSTFFSSFNLNIYAYLYTFYFVYNINIGWLLLFGLFASGENRFSLRNEMHGVIYIYYIYTKCVYKVLSRGCKISIYMYLFIPILFLQCVFKTNYVYNVYVFKRSVYW